MLILWLMLMSCRSDLLLLQFSSRHKLPEERTRPPKFEYGYLEPETIRPGRCSIRQSLKFLSEHRSDPDELGSAESIARRYNLDVGRVNNVLSHFGVFTVEQPKSLTEGSKDQSKTQFSVKISDTADDAYRKIWSTVNIVIIVNASISVYSRILKQ